MLLDNVKGELREREHHLPCVNNVTSSGIEIRNRIQFFWKKSGDLDKYRDRLFLIIVELSFR